jgi:uncharacterized protein (TIGR02145 family)
MTTMRIGVVAIALSMACGLVLDAGSTQRPGKDQNLSGTTGSYKGKAAFTALLSGGTSGFNAVFAGTRSAAGQYERLAAHGIYWTSSATDQNSARFCNFGKGGQGVSRHVQGGKQMAVSVRCVSP